MLASFLILFLIAAISSLVILQISSYAHKSNQIILSYNHESVSQFLGRFCTKLSGFVPQLQYQIGSKNISLFILSSFVICFVSVFSLASYLTKGYLAVLLGILISLSYIFRLYYFMASKFRHKLLFDIKELLMLISAYLSSGSSFDAALVKATQSNKEDLITKDLSSFIQIHKINLLKSFTPWLRTLRDKYSLIDMDNSIQILDLELSYTMNQEASLQNTAISIINRMEFNKKQGNTINLTFITIDMLIFLFLFILFYVIPSFAGSDWWDSARRPFTVGISGILLWGSYLSILVFSIWRQK